MSDLPDELVPDGTKIVTDQTECAKCGSDFVRGSFSVDGDQYCHTCSLEVRDNVTEVSENAALCECGNETSFKQTSGRGAGCWICPGCREMFAGVCDECGREAGTTAVFGRKGSYCRDCIRGGEGE